MEYGKIGLLLLASTLVVGCSEGESAWISGKATFAGKDIPAGALRFFTTDGTPGNGGGAEIINGNFEITSEYAAKKGMMAGNYRVSVVAIRSTGRKIRNPDGAGMINGSEMYIPSKYNRQTRLLVELEPGENKHDFKLEP